MFERKAPKKSTTAKVGPKTMIGTRLSKRQKRRLEDFALDVELPVQRIVEDALREYMVKRGAKLDDD